MAFGAEISDTGAFCSGALSQIKPGAESWPPAWLRSSSCAGIWASSWAGPGVSAWPVGPYQHFPGGGGVPPPPPALIFKDGHLE